MSDATLREESKATVRRPTAKLRVTWTDPLIDLSLTQTVSENNRVSYPEQVADLVKDVPKKWFHTNDTDVILDGSFFPMPSDIVEARRSQVGWWGSQSSGAAGEFLAPNEPTISVNFSKRVMEAFTVTGDNALNEFPVDFTVTVFVKSGTSEAPVEVVPVVGNTLLSYSANFANTHFNSTKIELKISKWSAPGKPVKIVEFYSIISETFESDDIFFMNILEEFEAAEGTLPVGNISCNEMDFTLQNITDRFFSENTNSDISNFIKRNRKVEPFLGFIYPNGDVEYVAKGLYWTGDWSVSDNGTGASTTARDRFELLRRKDFPWETVFTEIITNISLKELTERVLFSAIAYMYDFYYDISDLDDIYVVPHFDPEFFKGKSYFDVIKDLVTANLSYAYMDTPTQDEIDANGPLCKDMMRIKRVDTVFPSTAVPEPIEITKDDFIEKLQPANTESMANTINVIYKSFSVDPDDPEKFISKEELFTVDDADSIAEYGVMNYEYSSSDLIQYATLAGDIGRSLLEGFKVPKRDIELSTFGDVTINLADQLEVPEYQKNGIDKRGIFATTKINSQYDGSLRISLSGRKLREDDDEISPRMVQDTDGAVETWQDTDDAAKKLQDTGA